MEDDMGGLSKLGWSKSLGIALQTIARREKRDYAAIEFGWRSELRTWEFPKGEKVDPDTLLDYAAHFFGGGTTRRSRCVRRCGSCARCQRSRPRT
jgi:uncharacterized protein with von Willebrand factor type A (vWA) domain